MFDGSILCQQRFVQAYSRLKGLNWHTVQFAFDGQFLRSDLSVAQCDLGHGDIVDALFEQEEERSHANPVINVHASAVDMHTSGLPSASSPTHSCSTASK